MRRTIIAACIAASAFAAAPAAAATTNLCNVPMKMSDGATMYGNVFLPNATGRFPVVVTVTGYNKDVQNPTGTNCSPGGGLVSANTKLLDQGYAIMAIDDRGTGASEGTWDSWGERTQADYSEELDWIQAQPWSSGEVGMFGASYMAITSLLVAEADADRVAQGKPRAVKAVWADVPMADAYRDVTYHGGAVDAGFIPLWIGLTSGLSDIPPSTLLKDPSSGAPTYAGHLANTFSFGGQKILDATTGGDATYDGPFYRLRSPIERIKKLTIPVAWTGGWWDIFQRGEPLLYEQMTNSPHRKFFMTPNYHGAPDAKAWAERGIGPEADVQVQWFDKWIKGTDNGIDKLAPVNLYRMGADDWKTAPDFPLPGTKYTKFHLTDGKGLSTSEQAKEDGDTTPLLPASSPCSRLTAQWTAGIGGAASSCQTDNSTYEASALTYTTPPLANDTEATGLVTAELWATLSSTEGTLVAVLSDVGPDGKSNQLTAGFLLASQRANDDSRATKGPGGITIRPYHPYTRASQQAVKPGEPTRYQVEIYPTSNVFKAGHRIRLTLATSNTPTTLNTTPQTVNQSGGTLKLLRGGRYDSNVLLPIPGDSAAPVFACPARKGIKLRVPRPRGAKLRSAAIYVNGKRVKRVRGRRLRKAVRLRNLPAGAFKVKTVTKSRRGGRTFTQKRTVTYKACGAKIKRKVKRRKAKK